MDVVKREEGFEYEASPLPSHRNIQTVYIKCEDHAAAPLSVVKEEAKVSDVLWCKEFLIHVECLLSVCCTFLSVSGHFFWSHKLFVDDARFEVFRVEKIHVIFWVVMPCSFVVRYCFRGPCCLHLQQGPLKC
jgi:hypothetical protein